METLRADLHLAWRLQGATPYRAWNYGLFRSYATLAPDARRLCGWGGALSSRTRKEGKVLEKKSKWNQFEGGQGLISFCSMNS